MSSAGPRAIDRAFLRDIALGPDGALLAEARRMDTELAPEGPAERCDLVPARDIGPRDVVLLDDSGTLYSLVQRDGDWVTFRDGCGTALARAHVDDLVERIE